MKALVKRRLPWIVEGWRKRLYGPTMRTALFTRAFREHWWDSRESASGPGSTLADTESIRRELPRLIEQLRVGRLLDAPCGDFHWMRQIQLGDCTYVGVDIVPDIIERNRSVYGTNRRQFLIADLVAGALPAADLILCRDCLIHLPLKDALAVLKNFHQTGAKHLLITTYPECEENYDISTGDWHPVNLEAPPFNLPSPLERISETRERTLGLWRLADIP
jgi:SAM-dependent methyltransferase